MHIKKRRRIKIRDDSKLPAAAVFFIRFYKPLAVIAGVTIFFFVYNIYIVDRSMFDIQFALEETAKAQNIDSMYGLDIILDAAVLKELSSEKVDLESLMKLDFAAETAKDAQILSQAKDINFMLYEVLNKKKRGRKNVLSLLDALNEKIIKSGEQARSRIAKAAFKKTVAIEFEEGVFSAAKEFELKGDLNAAIKIYEDIFKNAPQYYGPEKIRLASLYRRTGNLSKTRIICEDIIQNSQYSQSVYIARRLLNNLRNVKSLQQKKKALEGDILKEIDPQRLQDLFYSLGVVNTGLEDFDGAAAAYKKSIEFAPKIETLGKAKFNLGFVYKMQKNYANSENIFRQLSDEFGQSDLGKSSNYWVADVLRGQGRHEEAVQKLQETSSKIDDDAVSSMSLFRAGYICLYDLNDPQRARLFFDELRRRFGWLPIGKYAELKILYDLSSVYRDEGFKLVLKGEFQDATVKFAKAIRLNPVDAFSYSGFGAAKGFMDELKEAIQKGRKAVALAPNDGYTNANLGFLYILKKDYHTAEKIYKKAVMLSPKYAEAQYNLGWLYQKRGDFEKAIIVYKQSIKYRPNLAVAYNNLGTCYWNIDRLKEALKYFINAVHLDGKSAEARYNLAKAYFLFSRLKQAEAEALKAVSLAKDSAKAEKLLKAIRDEMQEAGQ